MKMTFLYSEVLEKWNAMILDSEMKLWNEMETMWTKCFFIRYLSFPGRPSTSLVGQSEFYRHKTVYYYIIHKHFYNPCDDDTTVRTFSKKRHRCQTACVASGNARGENAFWHPWTGCKPSSTQDTFLAHQEAWSHRLPGQSLHQRGRKRALWENIMTNEELDKYE